MRGKGGSSMAMVQRLRARFRVPADLPLRLRRSRPRRSRSERRRVGRRRGRRAASACSDQLDGRRGRAGRR
jgi:hypothetical protein